MANTSGLRICPTCRELRGPIGDWRYDELEPPVELCRCDRDELRRLGRYSGPDHARHLELCRGCAEELVSYVAGATSHFCYQCEQMARLYNDRAVGCHVPTHPDPESNERFWGAGRRERQRWHLFEPREWYDPELYRRWLLEIAERLEALLLWRREQMGGVAAGARLDLFAGISLDDYLAATGGDPLRKQRAIACFAAWYDRTRFWRRYRG